MDDAARLPSAEEVPRAVLNIGSGKPLGGTTMIESWEPFSRVTLKASGLLACQHGTEWSCRLEAAQLYNGRVLVRATVDGKGRQLRDWAQRCQRFRISATLDDSRELAATDV